MSSGLLQKLPLEEDGDDGEEAAEPGGGVRSRYPRRHRSTLQRFNFDELDSEPRTAKRRRTSDSDEGEEEGEDEEDDEEVTS